MDGPLEIIIDIKITQQKSGTLPRGCVMIMNTHLLFLNKVTGPKDLCNATESPKLLLVVAILCQTADITVTR